MFLVYGVRETTDLAYFQQLKNYEQDYGERFKLIFSVTRENIDGMMSQRIPNAIADGELEKRAGITLSEDDSQVIICGNPGMIQESQQALYNKGLKKNLRRSPGNITVEKYW